MKAISSTLLVKQQDKSFQPYLRIYMQSRDEATSYTFTTKDVANRILSIRQQENPYDGGAAIVLSNADSFFTDKNLFGYKVIIGWGMVTDAGDEYLNDPPVWVYTQSNISQEGVLFTELTCIDTWTMMGMLRTMGEAAGASPLWNRDTTIRNIIGWMVGDRMEGAVADDGGVQTDETSAANSPDQADMHLLPATPAVNDAYYFGGRHTFNRLLLDVFQGIGDWTVTWEYWDGAAWTALSDVIDGTNGFRVQGIGSASYTKPTNWAVASVLGISCYWIRGRVSAYAGVSVQSLGNKSLVANLVTDTSDGVENTAKPVYPTGINQSTRSVIRDVLAMTDCVLRIRDDGLHIVKLMNLSIDPATGIQARLIGSITGVFQPGEAVVSTPAGATGIVVYAMSSYIVIEKQTGTWATDTTATGQSSGAILTISSISVIDYDYDSSHAFNYEVYDKALTMPNRAICVDIMPDSGSPSNYVGTAEDGISVAAIGPITQIFPDETIQSTVDANALAQRKITRIAAEIVRGEIRAPMNCAQELYDYVEITDPRAGYITKPAYRVGSIVREYSTVTGSYAILLQLGGLGVGADVMLGWNIPQPAPAIPPALAGFAEAISKFAGAMKPLRGITRPEAPPSAIQPTDLWAAAAAFAGAAFPTEAGVAGAAFAGAHYNLPRQRGAAPPNPALSLVDGLIGRSAESNPWLYTQKDYSQFSSLRVRRSATRIVSAYNSRIPGRWQADYKCNGDKDQEQINKALWDLPSGGGLVVLLEGDYIIDSEIETSRDNSVIMGAGHAVIHAKSGSTFHALIDLYNDNCEVRDIELNGHKATATVDIGIRFVSPRCKAINCYVLDVGGDWAGIYLGGDECQVISCRVSGCGWAGIWANDSRQLVQGCLVHNNMYGIAVWDREIVVIGNQVYSNAKYGIYDVFDNSIVGFNNVYRNGQHGIYVSSDNATIMGNLCRDNSQTTPNTCDGINLMNWDTMVIGNRCWDSMSPVNSKTQRYGIRLEAGSRRVIVQLNNCRDNRTGAISDLGTDTMLGASTTNNNMV